MALMLEPPPSVLPIAQCRDRPFRSGLGFVLNAQSRLPPMLSGQLAGALTFGSSSSPPASSKSTCTSGFSARRRATTDPEEPDPHTMKSYERFRLRIFACLTCANAIGQLPVCLFGIHIHVRVK